MHVKQMDWLNTKQQWLLRFSSIKYKETSITACRNWCIVSPLEKSINPVRVTTINSYAGEYKHIPAFFTPPTLSNKNRHWATKTSIWGQTIVTYTDDHSKQATEQLPLPFEQVLRKDKHQTPRQYLQWTLEDRRQSFHCFWSTILIHNLPSSSTPLLVVT